ncbi:hypothetical protein L8106_02737 [Lyngbya sp. PCC 8106]|nr:hypothetical protein L8106_02737 [Lyngbya sp. PCC 8106]
MGNYQVRFWRAVEGATPSLTLIILAAGLAVSAPVAHGGNPHERAGLPVERP